MSRFRLALARMRVRIRHRLTRFALERFDAPPEFIEHLSPQELGLPMEVWGDGDRHFHAPTPYGILARTLPRAGVSDHDVFLDLGCGTGRVVLEAAARYPFRRVIGVDFVADLTRVAEETVARNRDRLRCRDVEIVTRDVVDYDVPDDVTFVYLYNPFGGVVLDTVLDNLVASVNRRPRSLRILYFAPRERDRLERHPGIQFVRHGRRMVRRWRPAEYIAIYEVARAPAGAQPSATSADGT
jgi:SAM-dependent methyltransferase